MYCPKCGTFNPDNSRFCEGCGSLLSASSPTPSGDETVLLSSQKSVDSSSADDKTVLLTPKGSTATPPVPPRSEASASGPASSSAPTSPAFQPASVQRTQPGAAPNQNPGNPPKPAKSEKAPKTTKPHKRKKALMWVLVILLVLAGLGVGGWFGWNAYQGGQYQEQLSLGEKYLKELNYEDAIVALNRAIEIDPRSPEPYLLLADVYIGQEDFNSAKKVLEEGYQATGGNEEIKKKQEEVKQKEEEAKKKQEELKPSAVDIWEELIQSGEYQQYATNWMEWEGEKVFPGKYAILDIDGDNWEELILFRRLDDAGTGIHKILSCNQTTKEISEISIQLLLTPKIFGTVSTNFGGLYYSPNHHAIVNAPIETFSKDFGFWVIKGQNLEMKFSIGAHLGDSHNTTFTFAEYDEKHESILTEITESEYESYLSERQPIEFKEIPASSSESPATETELSADELSKYETLLNPNGESSNNCFLTSYYSSPEEIDPNQLLYSMGEAGSAITDEDKKALDLPEEPEHWYDNPSAKWTTSDINKVLQKKLGLTLDDLQTKLTYDYSSETDAYYSYHRDTNLAPLEVLYGSKIGDDTYCIGYTQGPPIAPDYSNTATKEVVFKDIGGELQFISNLKVE